MSDNLTSSHNTHTAGNSLISATSAKRIDWIDKLKAVAFFTVIVGHFEIPSDLKLWIYSFHMPLFFFITGMTFNIEKIHRTSFKDFLSRQAKRIIVPYFWLQMFSIAIAYMKNILITGKETPIPEYLLGILCSNAKLVNSASLPSYYAVLLFFVLMGLWISVKITKGKKPALFVLLSVLSLVSVVTQKVSLPWHLNVVPTGMLLVFIGRLLMDAYLHNEEKIRKLNKSIYIVICLVLFTVGYFLSDYNGRISLFRNFYGEEYLLFLVCSLITSTAFIMAVMLLPSSKLLSFIGQNTFFMLCLHFPLILVAEAIVTKKYITHPLFICVGAVVCFALLTLSVWIANKLCPYICGMPLKKVTLPVKLCKYAVIAAAFFAPYIYFFEHYITPRFSSFQHLTVVAVVLFALAVFVTERIFTLLMPFMFCSEKKKK